MTGDEPSVTVRAVTSAVRQQPLYIAMMICVVLSILNMRGGLLVVPGDDTNARSSMPWRSLENADRLDASQQISFMLDAGRTKPTFRKPMNHQRHRVRNETIVVGLANKAYVEVAILWYRRMEEVGYTTHRILAADMKTAWIAEELGLRYDDLSTYTKSMVPSCPNFSEDANNWDKKTYLFAARWIYVRQKLSEGFHVVLTDVDAVYNYVETLSMFEAQPYDHITAYADKMPANVFRQTGFTICGCFNWMRSTPSMIEYLDMFLSNCGCDYDKNVNGQCKCGCDDQVTMNSMLFYQMDMAWDVYEGGKDGLFRRNSTTGVSQRTGQRIKVLDRSFVYRGDKNNTCSKGNWITFPKTSNATESKMDQMKRLMGNCPLQKG